MFVLFPTHQQSRAKRRLVRELRRPPARSPSKLPSLLGREVLAWRRGYYNPTITSMVVLMLGWCLVLTMVLGWVGLFWSGLRWMHLVGLAVPLLTGWTLVCALLSSKNHLFLAAYPWAEIHRAKDVLFALGDDAELLTEFGGWIRSPRTSGEIACLESCVRRWRACEKSMVP